MPSSISTKAPKLEVPDLALEPRSGRILALEGLPRIGLELLESERDLLVLLVDVEDDRFDRIADGHNLRRVLHVARP